MTNMKKKYQKPEIEVVEFAIDPIMLTGSNPEIGDGGEAGDNDEADANRHRGEWGNLWAED